MKDAENVKAIAIVCITLIVIACLMAGIDHVIVLTGGLLIGGIAEKEILQPILKLLREKRE